MKPISSIILSLAILAVPSTALADGDLCYEAEVVPAADYEGDMTSWFGINNRGDMAGNFCADEAGCSNYDSDVWGAIYDASHGEVTWFTPPEGYNMVQMAGMNERGTVVGTAVSGNGAGGVGGAAAFVYEHGEAVVFDDPLGSGYWAATDINASGTIVGYSRRYFGSYSGRVGWVLDKHGAYEEIAVTGAVRTFPFAVNAHGDVCGYYLDGTYGFYGAFVQWADGTMELLTTVDSFFEDFTEVYAYGIDNDGTVVGAYVDWIAMERGAFVWPSGGEMQRFNVLDYDDTVFHSINEAGSIAGSANGMTEGLLVSPCK